MGLAVFELYKKQTNKKKFDALPTIWAVLMFLELTAPAALVRNFFDF